MILKIKKTLFVVFFFVFTYCNNAYSFSLFGENNQNLIIEENEKNNEELIYKNKKEQKKVFYNEKRDKNLKCEEEGCKINKNYSKIGYEDYTQNNIWRKYYVGIDFNWYAKRFGSAIDTETFAHKSFGRRFEDLDIYIGARLCKYFGAEIGYTHFGNFLNKNGSNKSLDGWFISGFFYFPMIDLKYTTIEPYISAGPAMLFQGKKSKDYGVGAKFGSGLIVKVYGSIAINLGFDYYYPLSFFAKKGLLTFKTGFNWYLSI